MQHKPDGTVSFIAYRAWAELSERGDILVKRKIVDYQIGVRTADLKSPHAENDKARFALSRL